MQGSDDPDSEEGARCGAVPEDSNPMTFCFRIKVLKMNVASVSCGESKWVFEGIPWQSRG